MCLTSKWRFPKIAKEDIVCYKVLEVNIDNRYFVTPYRKNIVDINKPYEAKEANSLSIFHPYTKTKGYIHTFAFIPTLQNLKERFDNPVVFKCIIPKGTKYHRGNFAYCSKKIIFKERLYNDD